MAKTANELVLELESEVCRRLTSGSIPLTIDGKKVDVIPELQGENGNYWCGLDIKEA